MENKLVQNLIFSSELYTEKKQNALTLNLKIPFSQSDWYLLFLHALPNRFECRINFNSVCGGVRGSRLGSRTEIAQNLSFPVVNFAPPTRIRVRNHSPHFYRHNSNRGIGFRGIRPDIFQDPEAYSTFVLSNSHSYAPILLLLGIRNSLLAGAAAGAAGR